MNIQHQRVLELNRYAQIRTRLERAMPWRTLFSQTMREGAPADRNRCGKNVFGVDGHYFILAYEIVSPPAPEIVR
jgi:hypothetical protein